ncbi:MAG: hypothetical protein JNL28_16175 [Planctomycetes bacterium]|nr:hypothetical protein [Planctomycetota bacterium]
MESKARQILKRLEKKMRKGPRGDRVVTVAFYGPDNRHATKVVAAVNQPGESLQLNKWFAEDGDVRDSDSIMQAVADYLDKHGAEAFVVTPGVYGCPHEEGIDYPEGKVCLKCSYWIEHDREAIFDA